MVIAGTFMAAIVRHHARPQRHAGIVLPFPHAVGVKTEARVLSEAAKVLTAEVVQTGCCPLVGVVAANPNAPARNAAVMGVVVLAVPAMEARPAPTVSVFPTKRR